MNQARKLSEKSHISQKKSRKMPRLSPKVFSLIRNLLSMILFPVLTFYLFEWYTHNPFTTMKVKIQFLNLFLFELLMVLLFFLFGRLKTALRCQTILFMLIGLANYYVISFRSAPIMPWDIYSLGTAMSVADNFKYTLEKETVFVLLGFIVLLFAESLATLTLAKTKQKLLLRATGLLVSFGILYGFTHMLHQESTVSKFQLYDKLFTPTVMSKRDGTAVAFLMELQYISVDKPQGYSENAAQELLTEYADETVVAATEDMPNIIVIMNEAFSDLSVLGDFATNEDYMPFIRSLMQEGTPNTLSGHLNVSVLGGNTANTEFEFLTGNTMAFLPQGSVAYQQYVKNPIQSIPNYLKSLGYQTVAMHPYNSTGWERNRVYPLLGFDTSYFIRDWTNPEKIRKYVSDKSCYDKLIEVFEEKEEGQPLFAFQVTMQNHSSYSEEYDNFTPDITVTDSNSKILPNYLSLIKLSDEAIEDLIAYFSEVDEDTIIVFFGDHQPTDSVAAPVWKLNGKSGDSLTAEEESLRYKVPFFIWANYSLTAESNIETSTNYLGARVLDAAGLPLYEYLEYLSQLEQSYPVVTAIRAQAADGTSTDVKSVREQLNQYALLQYYQIFDHILQQ